MARKKAATDPNAPAKPRGRPKKEKTVITNVNPDAVAACFLEYQGYMADTARIGQRMAKMLDRFEKSDGVDRKAIKASYKASLLDPAVAAAQMKRDREYMAILDIITVDEDGQTSLSDDFVPTAPSKPSADKQSLLARARASTDGYNSGFAGGSIDSNPHIPGSDVHQEWAIGFHDGHAERISLNPDAANITMASESRTRREPPDQTDIEEFTDAAA